MLLINSSSSSAKMLDHFILSILFSLRGENGMCLRIIALYIRVIEGS